MAVTVAGRIIRDKQRLLELFREEWQMIKESTIVDDWIQEGSAKGERQGFDRGIERGIEQGIEQGVTRGRLAAERNDVVAVLEARFDVVPPDVTRAITGLSDESLLGQLLRLAARVADLDQFREKLKTAIAMP